MPASPGGAGGGAAAGGSSFSDANTKRILDAMEATQKLIDAEEKAVKASGFMSAANIKATAELAKQKKAMDDLQKEYDDYTKKMEKATKAQDALVKKITDGTKEVARYASKIKEGITAYHSYNLSLQRAIDATGKFEGQSSRARQEFEQLRKSLSLTRVEAEKFSDAWTTGMRLGATNQQLERMVGNLQKIHGQTQGLQLARQILATPMTRTTMQGVAGGNVGAITTAMRNANLEQAQALANSLRKPENRPVQTQEAIRFERAQAKVARVMDDLKAGMQAFAAQGIGPEAAALLTPVTDIAANVAKLVENSSFARQVMARGAGHVPGMVGNIAKIFTGGGGGGGGLMNAVIRQFGMGGGGLGGGVGGMARAAGPAAGFALAGFLGGRGIDYYANRMQEGGTGQKGMRVLAHTARGAGYGAAIGSVIPGLGTGVGAGIGAGVGAAYGAAEQFGKPVVDAGKSFADWVDRAATGLSEDLDETVRGWTGVKKETPAKDMGELLNEMITTQKTVQEQLGKLGPTIEQLPETLRGAIATRAGEVGVATEGREGVETARAAFRARTDKSTGVIMKDIGNQIAENAEKMNNAIVEAQRGGKSPEEIAAIKEGYQHTNDIIEAELQTRLRAQDRGAGAELEMRRMETRRGQFGLEREAAGGRFRLGGAVTGDQGEILKYQKELTRTFAGERDAIAEGGKNADDALRLEEEKLRDQMAHTKIGSIENRQLGLELKDIGVKRKEKQRIVANQVEVNKLAEREAQLALLEQEAMSHRLTNTYRQAQQMEDLAKGEEALARARGATPEEFGAIAGRGAEGARAKLAEFQETAQAKIAERRIKAEEARAKGTNEGITEALKLEDQIRDIEKEELQLRTNAFELSKHAALIETEERQKQLSIQKNILELNRSSLTMMGASWQTVMAATADIARVTQEELKAAKEELAIAVENKLGGEEILKRQQNVQQKQNAVIETTIGKQRDFLEKAIAAGFGMGGGTKALPNINQAKIFGQQFLGLGGMRVQGAGATVQQQEAMRAGGGAIPGLGGGPGGLGPLPVLPGLKGPVQQPGQVPAVPGGGQAKPGGEAAAATVDGRISVVVKSDNGKFTAEVEDIAMKVVQKMGKPGAVV